MRKSFEKTLSIVLSALILMSVFAVIPISAGATDDAAEYNVGDYVIYQYYVTSDTNVCAYQGSISYPSDCLTLEGSSEEEIDNNITVYDGTTGSLSAHNNSEKTSNQIIFVANDPYDSYDFSQGADLVAVLFKVTDESFDPSSITTTIKLFYDLEHSEEGNIPFDYQNIVNDEVISYGHTDIDNSENDSSSTDSTESESMTSSDETTEATTESTEAPTEGTTAEEPTETETETTTEEPTETESVEATTETEVLTTSSSSGDSNIFYIVAKNPGSTSIFSSGCEMWIYNNATGESVVTTKQEADSDDEVVYAYAEIPNDWTDLTFYRTDWLTTELDINSALNIFAPATTRPDGANAIEISMASTKYTWVTGYVPTTETTTETAEATTESTEATTESTEETTEETTGGEPTTESESTEDTSEATTESTEPQPIIYSIYYIPAESSVQAGYTYKINIQDADGNWHTYDMEATGETVNGLPLYSVTITDPDYFEIAVIQYQVYSADGTTWVSQTEFEVSATLNDYSDKALNAATGRLSDFTVDTSDETTETTIPQYSSVSGATGDCTWTYNPATSTLTISGTGNMDVYSLSSLSPWYSYNGDINTIIISGNVTSIGDYAFYDSTKITSITIPDSVTSIGDSAFSGCTKLTSATIGNSVESIGNNVFFNCTKLTSITVPANVTSIGYDVFYNCNNLIMYGYTGSYAETYAKNNNITFVSIGEVPTEPTTEEPTSESTEDTEPTTDVTEPTTEATEPTTEATEPTTASTNSASMKLSKTKLKAGKTAKATVNGTNIASVTYTSSDKKIAKVNKTTGKVTAKKKGTTTIKATVIYLDGSKEVLTKKIRVTSNPKLNKKTVTLKKGKTFKLKVTGLIGKAKYKVSNAKVVKINSKGKITAKKKGKATITVTANGVKLKCKVKVKK